MPFVPEPHVEVVPRIYKKPCSFGISESATSEARALYRPLARLGRTAVCDTLEGFLQDGLL